MVSFTFKKAERLCSKTLIDNLFSKGNRVTTQFPFRVIWQFVPENSFASRAQVLVSVPKKGFPNATDRNRIKRQIRELYRMHKHLLYDKLSQSGKKTVIAINFQGKARLTYQELGPAFEKLFIKLLQQIEQDS